jgi:hypothetical protein
MARVLHADAWRDVYLCNTFSWMITGWYTVEGSVELHYTGDPLGPDIWEVRPWLGQKFTFAQFLKTIHLERPYFYVRLDQRFLWYPEEGGTPEIKTRVRPRLGGRFILNNTSLEPKTFYIPFYAESFINLNDEATERFASIRRAMIGVGYIINPRWRTEIDYYTNRSRNTVDDDFARTDMIIQIQLRYFFQYQTLR